ncbi:MAG: hypothetical protein K6B13_13800, partial [Prevotella sp.]|nr:hypothetical protein [Prevotella sp.]
RVRAGLLRERDTPGAHQVHQRHGQLTIVYRHRNDFCGLVTIFWVLLTIAACDGGNSRVAMLVGVQQIERHRLKVKKLQGRAKTFNFQLSTFNFFVPLHAIFKKVLFLWLHLLQTRL